MEHKSEVVAATRRDCASEPVAFEPTHIMPRTNTHADKALNRMVKKARPEETFTLQQIAGETGLSAERIRQIERQALRKVRKGIESWLKREGFDEYLPN